MSTQLARIEADDLEILQRTGKLLAASGYFTKGDTALQVAQMAVKIMAGRELGMGPFASAQGIHIIDGKPSISANLMATAVRASHRYDYRIRKLTETECELEFFDLSAGKRESLGLSRYDTADATRAGLTNKDNWKRHPKNMLFARAMSNGVRWMCPDVFGGNAVYVPEELGEDFWTDPDLPPGARVVDGVTGEILQPQDEDMGMGGEPPRKLGSITRSQEKELHALGQSMHGEKWDEVRHKNIRRLTEERTQSIHDLTQAQANTLIDGLCQQLVKRIETQIAQQQIDLDALLKGYHEPSLAQASPVTLTHIWKDVKGTDHSGLVTGDTSGEPSGSQSPVTSHQSTREAA